MKNNNTLNQRPDRRSFLAGLGASGLVSASFSDATAATQDASSIHLQIANEAKIRFGGWVKEISVLSPQGAGANLAPIVKAFHELTGIRVSVVEAGIDMVDSELMLDSMLGAGRFDVALPATFALPDLIAAGAIVSVDKWKQQFEPVGYRANALYPSGDVFDGQNYGFQTDGDAYLMFYHGDMMKDERFQKEYADQTGTSLAVAQTWSELDRQMAFFHNPDANRYGGILFRRPGYQIWEWWLRFHGKGQWPFSSEMKGQINSEAGVLALEEMIGASEYLEPGAYHMGVFDNADRFSQGDIFCTIGWGGTQKRLNLPASPMRDRMIFAQPPGGIIGGKPVHAPYFNWGWSYVVTASSQTPELGYLFSLFATSPEMSTIAVRQVEGFFDPFLAEHYDDAGIIAAYSEPFLAQHRIGLQEAIPDLYIQGQTLYLKALGEGLEQAMQSNIDPEAALSQVVREWELITTRIGRASQKRSWAHLKKQYPPVFRSGLQELSDEVSSN